MTDSRPLYPAPADGARWRVLYEGSGFSMTEPHPDENAAYITARAAAERAATGDLPGFGCTFTITAHPDQAEPSTPSAPLPRRPTNRFRRTPKDPT